MNDRFKFRAWNKEERIMYYNAELAYDSMNGTPPLMHDSFGTLLDDDNYIVEQCTGLTDRHNKLIYENDVVNVYIPYEDNHRKCVVQYVIDEGTAQWLAVYLEGKRPHCSMGICYDITSEYLDGSYCTVIGNIHEMEMEQ